MVWLVSLQVSPLSVLIILIVLIGVDEKEARAPRRDRFLLNNKPQSHFIFCFPLRWWRIYFILFLHFPFTPLLA
jgi:hypothetical protein